MAADLPLLPTTVVGSYAHPSWFYAAKELMEADRFGPTDVEETFDDAVDRAIADQVEAGLDIVSDGEMRRASFVWAFASRMTGLRDAGPLRKMGPMSLDMRSVQETTGPVGVPDGAVTTVSFADAQFDAAVADLERVLREQRDQLNPRTVLVLERNLQVIDDAIREARTALDTDPANALLNAHLASARQRKLNLLRRAALISEGV